MRCRTLRAKPCTSPHDHPKRCSHGALERPLCWAVLKTERKKTAGLRYTQTSAERRPASLCGWSSANRRRLRANRRRLSANRRR